jgi:hypothetical protein
MAYTSTQLADLRAAIAEGVLSVRFSDGRQLTYRSLDEMRRIEQGMAAELEPTTTVRLRRSYYGMTRPT